MILFKNLSNCTTLISPTVASIVNGIVPGSLGTSPEQSITFNVNIDEVND